MNFLIIQNIILTIILILIMLYIFVFGGCWAYDEIRKRFRIKKITLENRIWINTTAKDLKGNILIIRHGVVVKKQEPEIIKNNNPNFVLPEEFD